MIDNEKAWSTTSHPLPLETDVENLICKHDKLFNLRQKKVVSHCRMIKTRKSGPRSTLISVYTIVPHGTQVFQIQVKVLFDANMENTKDNIALRKNCEDFFICKSIVNKTQTRLVRAELSSKVCDDLLAHLRKVIIQIRTPI